MISTKIMQIDYYCKHFKYELQYLHSCESGYYWE